MIDANKGASEEVLRRLKEESYERFRIQLYEAVRKLLFDFEMTWKDLADKLSWQSPFGGVCTGDEIKKIVGSLSLRVEEINQIAHCFSSEPYVIFRPRQPWIKS